MKTKQVVMGLLMLTSCSGGFTTGRGEGAWVVGTTSWLSEVNQAGKPRYSVPYTQSVDMDEYTQAERDALSAEINKKGVIKTWKR